MGRSYILDTNLECCDSKARVMLHTSNFEVDDDAMTASTPFPVIYSAHITSTIFALVLSYVSN
jgi:hypothetical protein